jgi:hypothetical protein
LPNFSTMQIRPYTPDLEPAVQAFNRRMIFAGERFPESHVPDYPRIQGRPVYQDYFVVTDRHIVRGGYKLMYQAFWIRDKVEMIAGGPQGAVSEGIVDPHFRMVGIQALLDALRREQNLFALGIGGARQGFARLLAAGRWTLDQVPFYFKVVNPDRFLANIRYLRQRPGMAPLCDFLRGTFLGHVAIRAAQVRPPRLTNCHGEVVPEFGVWADELWENARHEYSFVAVRDAAVLSVLYSDSRLLRMRISRSSRTIGWVVMLNTPMSGHKQFGDVRLGSIVDCMAKAADAAEVIYCATEYLQAAGADLIVSNQSHHMWRRALFASGFLRGPSNYLLALSPKLAAKLQPLDETRACFHLTRGDGDGPIHL